MAHKKGAGSSDNGRDSNSKRLGVKLFGGQLATAGNIIVRQRGTKFHPGSNVYLGKDFTLHAGSNGTVQFVKKRKNRIYVNILLDETTVEVTAKKAIKAPAKAEKTPAKAANEPAKATKAPAKAEKGPAKAAKAPAKAAKATKATIKAVKASEEEE